MSKNYWKTGFIFFILCFALTSTVNASSLSVTPDTGNMNEPDAASRRFGVIVTFNPNTLHKYFEFENINTGDKYCGNSTLPGGFPVDDTGAVEYEAIKRYPVRVSAKVSWRNDNNYVNIFTKSYTPGTISGAGLAEAPDISVAPRTWNETIANPNTWGNPAGLIVTAEMQVANGNWVTVANFDEDIPMPPASAEISLGGGSTHYEWIESFSGGIGTVKPCGATEIDIFVGIGIRFNPWNGAYDPTSNAARVWVDLTGGTNPTTQILSKAKRPGLWWDANGMPGPPFVLPFHGTFEFPASTPGVVVGGVGISWPPWPVLGASSAWNHQNTYTWRLPPRTVVVTIPTGNVYQYETYEFSAETILRELQITERILGYSWNFGDGTVVNNLSPQSLTSEITHTYTTSGLKKGTVTVRYNNSDSQVTTLQAEFEVDVKPLAKVHVPNTIIVEAQLADNSYQALVHPGEDVVNYYRGPATSLVERIVTPAGKDDYHVYFKFSDGVPPLKSGYLDKAQQHNRVSHKFDTLGAKTVELWLRSHRAELVGGSLNVLTPNDSDGYYHELITTENLVVEAQNVFEGDDEQRITFKVSPVCDYFATEYDRIASRTATLEQASATITFECEATIFYARREETALEEHLDQMTGVRPGSVEYRWKILCPDGNDAYEADYVEVSDSSLLEWNELEGKETDIDPIDITFKVPFGTTENPNRFYNVLVEARYQELAWKPIYSAEDPEAVIDWEDDINYANNNLTREIIWGSTAINSSDDDFEPWTATRDEPPLIKTGTGNDRDALYNGSLYVRVKLNDRIPAKFVLVDGPTQGTSGDPLTNATFTMIVANNNPDAILKAMQVEYDRHDATDRNKADSYLCESELLFDDEDDELAPSLALTYGSIASITHKAQIGVGRPGLDDTVGFYVQDGDHLPNYLATTMTPDGNGNNGTLSWWLIAHIDDGQQYNIVSSQRVLTITDNDPPSVKVTFVNTQTGESKVYEVSGGVNDPLGADADVKMELRIVSSTNDSTPFSDDQREEKYNKTEEADRIYNFSNVSLPDESTFRITRGERFLYTIEVEDNVNSNDPIKISYKLEETDTEESNIQLYLSSTKPYKGSLPVYQTYHRPTDGVVEKIIDVEDAEGNVRSLSIPIEVVEPDLPQIRVLEQKN